MKTICLVISMVLLHVTQLSAQTASPETPTWGLQYQIGSDFTLYSFSGTSLSLIRIHSEKNSTRLGITFSGSATSNLGELTGTNTSVRKSDDFDSRFSLSLHALRLRHAELHEKIRPYIGAGLNIPFNIESSKSTTIGWDTSGNENQNTTHRNYNHSVGLSALAVVGFEWFVRKNMSLSSEYHNSIGISYSSRIQKNNSQNNATRSESNRWTASIPNGSVRTSLTVYF